MRTRTLLSVAAFVVVFVPVVASSIRAQDAEALANNPKLFIESATKNLKWNDPAEPTKIVGPIYFVGTQGLSSWLITSSEGHILLCTGMPSSGPMIEESIRKLGFKPQDIKLLLVGHAHIDHVGGHAYIKRISGAQVAMMAAEADLLQSGGRTDFHYANVPEFRFEPVKVDRLLKDGETIKLGDIAMTALHTPGHTRGSTTWIMTIEEDGKEYGVIFPDGTGVNPGYRLADNPSYPKIADDFDYTFKVLRSFRPDIWLTPHTELFDFEGKKARAAMDGAQAWVDPEGYRKWVAIQRARFESQMIKETGGAPPKQPELPSAPPASAR